MAHPGVLTVSEDNPLGLPLDVGTPAKATYKTSGEAARQFNLEYRPAKVQAEDLKLAKAYVQLQRGLLSMEGIEHFDT